MWELIAQAGGFVFWFLVALTIAGAVMLVNTLAAGCPKPLLCD